LARTVFFKVKSFLFTTNSKSASCILFLNVISTFVYTKVWADFHQIQSDLVRVFSKGQLLYFRGRNCSY